MKYFCKRCGTDKTGKDYCPTCSFCGYCECCPCAQVGCQQCPQGGRLEGESIYFYFVRVATAVRDRFPKEAESQLRTGQLLDPQPEGSDEEFEEK